MNGFCPNCEKDSPLEVIRKTEDFNIRGEIIPVEVELNKCQICGEEFENPKSGHDPYELAYREYRNRAGMAQPEEIRQFRLHCGLTQKEFSALLGVGIATLNRYENGALQSEAHDRMIKMAMDSRNFAKLVSESRGILNDSKKRKILEWASEETEISWQEATREIFGSYNADVYSGYKKFELEKFFQTIRFFCFPEGVSKTKLMKLLFYADFGHFKKYSVSITGARYARLPYGPVPDQFEKWLDMLESDEKGLRKEEVWYGEYSGEEFISDRQADLSVFDTTELRILAAVKEVFHNHSAKQISDRSHGEKGYQETKPSQVISYGYAEELSMDF
jgi:putative zinc finger/helix-turn-helix YgiT family protein